VKPTFRVPLQPEIFKDPTRVKLTEAQEATLDQLRRGKESIQEPAPAPMCEARCEEPPDWMLEPRPASDKRVHIYMEVWPEIAEQWLRECNTNNRPQSSRAVDLMVQDMERGEWLDSGQTITFSKDGTLINGQHRLAAIVRSKKSQPFDVIFGLDAAAFRGTDIGRTRTASDMAMMMGFKDYNVTAGVARLITIDEKHGIKVNGWDTCTKQEVLDTLQAEYERIHTSLQRTRKYFKTKVASSRILIFCHYQFSHPNQFGRLAYCLQQEGLMETVDRFFSEALEGLHLEKDNPAYHLHRKLAAIQRDQTEKIAEPMIGYFRLAWLAFRDNRKPKLIRWDLDPYPEL
jgi:hypothetical protein